MFPTASPFPRIKSIINTSGWEVGSCAVLDTVWVVPVGSRWALGGLSGRVGSSCSAMQVPAGFPVGSRWAPCGFLSLSEWVRGGLRVGFAAVPCGLGFWGGLRGGVGCKLPPYPPKEKRRNNIEWSAELRRLRALGGPKLAAPTETHIERKLAPTISPVSAIMAILL